MSPGSLASLALGEMKLMSSRDIDCWHTRVTKMKTLFSLNNMPGRFTADKVGKRINASLKSKFSIFWKTEISRQKLDSNGVNRNKLRFYQTLKSSFKI